MQFTVQKCGEPTTIKFNPVIKLNQNLGLDMLEKKFMLICIKFFVRYAFCCLDVKKEKFKIQYRGTLGNRDEIKNQIKKTLTRTLLDYTKDQAIEIIKQIVAIKSTTDSRTMKDIFVPVGTGKHNEKLKETWIRKVNVLFGEWEAKGAIEDYMLGGALPVCTGTVVSVAALVKRCAPTALRLSGRSSYLRLSGRSVGLHVLQATTNLDFFRIINTVFWSSCSLCMCFVAASVLVLIFIWNSSCHSSVKVKKSKYNAVRALLKTGKGVHVCKSSDATKRRRNNFIKKKKKKRRVFCFKKIARYMCTTYITRFKASMRVIYPHKYISKN